MSPCLCLRANLLTREHRQQLCFRSSAFPELTTGCVPPPIRLITGSLNVQRSIKGLNISVSNEIDLQIPKDTRVVMKNAAKGAAGPKQLSFVWLNTNDPPPNQRSYQLSLAPETSSGDVTRLIDVLREWTNLVDEAGLYQL